jgi:hypothetical protein
MKRTSNEISDLILNNQINLYNKIYSTIENDFGNIPDSKLGLLIEVMMDLETKIQLGMKQLKVSETFSTYRKNENGDDLDNYKGVMMLNLS